MLRDTLHAAAAGDPSALAGCDRLVALEDRSYCQYEVLSLSPAARSASSCDTIEAPLWRAECHFSLAEVVLSEGDAEAAVRACERAVGLELHCARHLTERAVAQGPGVAAAVSRLLQRRMPEILAEIVRTEAERRSQIDGVLALSDASAAAAARERLRQVERLSVADCGGDQGCIAAAGDELVARWEVSIGREAHLLTWICDSAGPTPPPEHARLAWEGEVLTQRMRTFVADRCVEPAAGAAGALASVEPMPAPDPGAVCATQLDRRECLQEAGDKLVARWTRMADREPAVQAALCADGGPKPPADRGSLSWGNEPILAARVVALAASRCGGR